MDDLAERIARLSPAKQALLALRLRERERATAGGQTIPRRPGGGLVPLSFAQQRLWFLDQLEPNSPLYNNTRAFRIRGPLDVEALREALDALLARHESLRTTFVATDGAPAQVIADRRPAELMTLDVAAGPEAGREATVRRMVLEEARRPFDLSGDLMLRATLIRSGAEDHVLLLTIHHIVSDWWSMRILLAELGTLYGAFATGQNPGLPDLPIQYADYAHWQREWLQWEVLERQLAYWKRHLKGAPPALDLPTDRPRPAEQTYRGVREATVLPASLMEALKDLCRPEGVTPFMALLAAFQVLLSRYTGQEDIVVGSPIAGRTRLETEALIGFFVNSLALRTDLSGTPTFRELLRRVREVALGAYAHQDIPFERLVEALHPERDLSRAPIFQVMLVLQDSRRPTLHLHGLTVDAMDVHNGTSKFDLSLTLVEGAAGTQASLEYSTDLFDAATMARLLGHFRTLLEGIVADPARPISALPLLTDSERRQMLVEWNATGVDFPDAGCLHHRVEAQAAQTPDPVAVACREQTLTYGQLNRRANQLAHHLRARGVGPDVLVGICMERSLELVVGLLGVLKAGGAYVPLDPGYPAARLSFMLADSGAPVLLTQARFRSALPPSGAQVVCLDADWLAIAGAPDTEVAGRTTPEHLAYVIYTSGSTGQPKGVMISHRAIENHMRWMAAAFPLTPDDAVLQKTPISFDASVWEFWAPLQAGARLVLAKPDGHRDPAYLVRALAEHAVTRLQLVPSQLRLLLEEPDLAECRCLRHVFCGGEALPADLQARFFQRLPWAALHNLYGPTEAAIDATCWTCARDEGPRTVPIGRPIPNTQIHLLDRHGQPVPVGVPGELHIGGAGLARGYLNRPELTAEKFVPHPFSSEPGARLYKTGDLARYRADGALEFLERTDTQVKLRGFRIELGEIETALAGHPGVREAVVVVREDTPGDQRLVAYVVPAEAEAPPPAALRAFVQATLPDYMLPAAFVAMSALPLTPNGKVDRKALPSPEVGQARSAETFIAPRDMLEVQLTKIWEKVLGVQSVGVRDNFFDLGGHSLLAVRLLAAIAKHVGKELPLATFFRAPTIEKLAGILRQDGWSAPWTALVPLQPGGSRPPLFCVHQHHGHTYWARPLAQHLGPDQPVYGLEAQGLDGRHAPRTCIKEMAAHYVQEIRRLQPDGPYHLSGYCFGGIVAFEMAQQLVAQGERVGLVALVEASWRSAAARDEAAKLRAQLRRRLAFERDRLAPLSSGARLRHLLIRAAVYGRERPARILAWLRERRDATSHVTKTIRRVEAANMEAQRRYAPRPYAGRLALFRPAGPTLRLYGDRNWGWGELAAGGIQVHELPSTRPTMVEEPDVTLLAARMRACLAEAAGPGGNPQPAAALGHGA